MIIYKRLYNIFILKNVKKLTFITHLLRQEICYKFRPTLQIKNHKTKNPLIIPYLYTQFKFL